MFTTTPKRLQAIQRAVAPVLGTRLRPISARVEPLEPRRLLAAEPYHWPLGTEMRVNSYTPSVQSAPAMAMDADGDFVVAWASDGQDGSSSGVYAQRYNATGLPQGAEFRVNTTTTDTQQNPTVAMDADGDFVIAWESAIIGYYGYVYDADVYAQRYNASGVPQGTEFLVNTYTTDLQLSPSIAMDGGGDFVVTWQSGLQDGSGYGVYAQRYSAAGVEQGTEFQVNTYTTGIQYDATAAMDPEGNFVVTWIDRYQDGSDSGIYAQRYNAAGITQGTEFRVNTYTTSTQQSPSAAMDADGDFVVTWDSYALDGSRNGIYAQRFNAAGAPQGTEFRVNSYTSNSQQSPSVAVNATGDFVVTWMSAQVGSYFEIYAQRYNAAGVPQGTEFRINTYTTNGQHFPSAAMDEDGDFVVTWDSFYQDASSTGVYAQRYTTFGAASAATVGDRVFNDSNANGIQDVGELGIAGATVELFSGDGAGVATVSTDATGQYSIPVLAGQPAYLHFVNPLGLLTTHQNRGANDDLDSDVDRVTGRSPIFIAGAAGTVNSSLDAGFCLPGSVNGIAFYDRSGDGVRNGGEEALAGFQVFMDLDADGVSDLNEPFATTNLDGSYGFGGLLGDTYRVGVVDQSQWVEPALSPFFVMPGASSSTNLPLRTSAHDSISAAGSEFRPNSTTQGVQNTPSTAMDDNGNFVVAWGGGGAGDDSGIFAQRYNAAGVKQGSEFRVNTYTTNSQGSPAAAMDADGDFVVTWSSFGQDGSYGGVYAQRYNAAGVKQGIEFRVNTYTTHYQFDPSVAMDDNGDFVVTWNGRYQDGNFSGGIYAQRYSAGGAAQGGEFRVSSNTIFNNVAPSVAMDADGDFVVAWTSGFEGYYYSIPDNIHVQRYNAAGVSQGTEFEVSTFSYLAQRAPSVAMDDDGDFVIAWQTPGSSGWDIRAQRYSAAGVAQGEGFNVNTFATGEQTNPSAAMDADGDFVIAYSGGATWCDFYAQRYNAAGMKQGNEFKLNSATQNYESPPSVATDAQGNFVVSWWGVRPGDNSSGIISRRYSVSQRPAITSSQFVWQTAPQRIEFTFDQDVSASLTASDLVLKNLTTGATIPTNQIVRSWNAATKTATFTFPTLPNGGSLPDGDYRATLPAAAVSNTAGTSLAVDYALDFFFLGGDADHDADVDLDDFNILASNFNQTGRNFTQGDFTYDGIVNLNDFNILAAKFNVGTSMPFVSSRSGPDRIIEGIFATDPIV